MKNSFSSKFALTALVAGALIISANSAFAAAKTHIRTRTGTYQNSNGKSGTFTDTTTHSPGETQRQDSWTNQDGKTGTHESTRTWDKTTGTGTVSSSTTLPDGKTSSRTGTIAKTGDNTYESKGTVTTPNGKVATYDAVTTKTATGRTTQDTITGPNGKQTTVNSTVTKEGKGEVERATTITGPNGKTEQKNVETKVNPDGSGTRTVQITKPDGTTETRTENFTTTSTPAPTTN
jgi:hypothetical protein